MEEQFDVLLGDFYLLPIFHFKNQMLLVQQLVMRQDAVEKDAE